MENEQLSVFDDNPEYEAFVEKFKPKKTTNDCYTPPEIYEVIRDYVCARWGIDPANVVRPFYPGGDYERFNYSGGAVVIDNPPFSILSKIVRYYLERRIPFFLFAPSLTCFTSGTSCNHIVTDCSIIYENGANVKTSFVTSFGMPTVAESCPELTALVNDKMNEILRRGKVVIPKYTYPDHICTAAMLQKYARYGVRFSVNSSDCLFTRAMDEQKKAENGKGIFGGGFLLSERAAAERAAAERAAAVQWKLSEREKALVASMG